VKALARPALEIDILVDAGCWKGAKKMKSLLPRVIRGAAAATLSTTGMELAIVLTDDSAIRRLNRVWRGIDAATNVLSFPTKNAGDKEHLGDIVLAFETITREARAERKPFSDHVAHLAVHGFLHLIGYDHEDEREAARMEQTEREILRHLEIPDPYRTGAKRPAAKTRKRSGRR
jgi:probable rRNA maturation factor